MRAFAADCRSAGQFSSLGRTFYRGVRRYRRELNDPKAAAVWLNEDDDALSEALDLGLGDDLGEERIEGLETAIEGFQKAVRQLRRKLRRLEGRCNRLDLGGRGHDREDRDDDREDAQDGCVEEAGGLRRRDGAEWQRDPCTHCTCKVSPKSTQKSRAELLAALLPAEVHLERIHVNLNGL